MKNHAAVAVFVLAFALPVFAETSEFGFLFGGAKRMNDVAGTQGQKGINDFKFSNSVKEAYFATEIDPGADFRIKVGAISLPLVYTSATAAPAVIKGTVDHIDALVDYKFSEPFGSTGIFAGVGMYRTKATGHSDDTNIGVSGGVNADLPLSRRYGIIGEATYHWLRTTQRQRFVTLTGGLRISF